MKEKPETTELDAVNRQIQTLQSERGKLDRQFVALSPQLAETQSCIEKAQKRLAQGDETAGAELQRLETQSKTLKHKHDGLRAVLDEVTDKIRPLQVEADTIRERLRLHAENEAFDFCKAKLNEKYDNAFTKVAEASQALGEWRVEERQFRQAFGTRAAIVIDQLNQGPMLNPISQLVNIRKWQRLDGTTWSIAPLLPPNGQAKTATQSR